MFLTQRGVALGFALKQSRHLMDISPSALLTWLHVQQDLCLSTAEVFLFLVKKETITFLAVLPNEVYCFREKEY